MKIEQGSMIGCFEAVALIGGGGMGQVYRARDTKLGRDVAIKVLRDRGHGSSEVIARFEQEARSASALNHPNIVTIHEIGAIDGQPYIVMEYVDGPTLRDAMRLRSLSIKQVVRIASDVADALAAAHEKGIVHRDLKPENVVLTSDGRPKILDFGLAKLAEVAEESETTARFGQPVTEAGSVMGTPGYMSPEQASGARLDHRSDQFSLGVILYEMLTGEAPFRRGTNVETMAAIIRGDAEPVEELNPGVPVELSRIIARCMEKSASDRYASTSDLAHDLRGVSVESGRSRVSPLRNRVVRRIRRHRTALVSLALAAVAVTVGSVILVRQPRLREATLAQSPAFPQQVQLLVLPFSDVSGVEVNERFALGLSESVAARLSRIDGVHVIGPRMVMAEGDASDLRAICRALGANVALQSSLLRSDDRVRVTFAFVDPATGVHLAADAVNGSSSDLFAVEDTVVDAILTVLNMRRPLPARGGSAPLTASGQDRYFQAIGFLQNYEDETSVDSGIALLTELRREASESALLPAALARAYLLKYYLTKERAWAERAEVASTEAASRDPTLLDVRITMGQLYMSTGRIDDAVASFGRALELQPTAGEALLGYGEALARAGRLEEAAGVFRKAIDTRPGYWGGYNRLAVTLVMAGRLDEAEQMFRRAIELSPGNVRLHYNLSALLVQLGRFEDAIASAQKSIEIRPNSGAFSNLGTCNYYIGRFNEAVEAFEHATALSPADSLHWYNLGDARRWSLGADERATVEAYGTAIRLAEDELQVNRRNAALHLRIAGARAKRGEMAAARAALANAEQIDPSGFNTHFFAAMIANVAGDRDAATARLRDAVEAGCPTTLIEHDPEFLNLRDDPAFRAIVRGKR